MQLEKKKDTIEYIGLGIFLFSLLVFLAIPFMNNYRLNEDMIRNAMLKEGQVEAIINASNDILGKNYPSKSAFIRDLKDAVEGINMAFREQENWQLVVHDTESLLFELTKSASHGWAREYRNVWFLILFIMGPLGALLYIFIKYFRSKPGINNNNKYLEKFSNRGWNGIVLGIFLITFYILLYFFPAYIAEWTFPIDGFSKLLTGEPAGRWFLYGFIYTLAILLPGLRFMIKYRHSRYHLIRTTSVIFFQLIFAFMVANLLYLFNLPSVDLKNIWPLDYSFFFEWRIKEYIQNGTIGIFMLIWGILLAFVSVPLVTFLVGKRWYCSWVCGCGGLAETAGDSFRHLSDKSLAAWRVERVLVHSVLVFAILMTAGVLFTFFTEKTQFLFFNTFELRETYGFAIGAIFAGVIGTGFYPFMGNRVWCRFGCPLAAYLGIVQRFKSRFRITTNGGQCISCGNCSAYCEMGIDVRWYAQRGQNIIRASCVGCGICAAVCPRGVLRLENGPEKGRFENNQYIKT